jgi:type II pantothenate kinase
MIVAIDVGSTTTDAVVRVGDVLTARSMPSADAIAEPARLLSVIAEAAGFAPEAIEQIATTGVGARALPERLGERPVIRIDEFHAIGAGGTHLAQLQRTLVVSVGTGTAIVAADNGRYRHFGGTGIGGGTLTGLARQLLGIAEFRKLETLSRDGDRDRVDLLIGDIAGGPLNDLPAAATAANFGKATGNSAPADVAAALINMVAESIGSLSLAAARATNHQTIVVVGRVASSPAFRERIERFAGIDGRRWILPEHAASAVAIGALELAAKGTPATGF